MRVAAVLAGTAALTAYLPRELADPGAHWPLWDVNVYWRGGRQAVPGGALHAPHQHYGFTYLPFAAALSGIGADAPEGCLKMVITVASVAACRTPAARHRPTATRMNQHPPGPGNGQVQELRRPGSRQAQGYRGQVA